MNVDEEWRSVHEDYLVSESGVVRRTKGGRSKSRCLKLSVHRQGYLRVWIYINSGYRKQILVHELVAEAFIGPKPDGYEVNHKDCDKSNNHYSNLEYVLPIENKRHSLGMGNLPAIITADDVREMRKLYDSGEKTITELAEMFGMKYHGAHGVVKRHRWKWLD